MTTKELLVIAVVLSLAFIVGGTAVTFIVPAIQSAVSNLQGETLGNFNAQTVTLIGSVSDFVSTPSEKVFASATTTNSGGTYTDGGYTVQQEIDTGGLNDVILSGGLQGKTATATVFILQQGSVDGTNFTDILSATTTNATLASSTLSFVPSSVRLQPGTASTTFSYTVSVRGYKKTRFLIWSAPNDGVTDGVQAWITATKIQDLTK